MPLISVFEGTLQALPVRTMRARDQKAIGRLEKKYPWLAKCRWFWGASKGGSIPAALQINVRRNKTANSTELRAILAGDGKLGFGWGFESHASEHPWVLDFIKDVLQLLGPGASLTSRFTVWSRSGNQEEQWTATLDNSGEIDFAWIQPDPPAPVFPEPKRAQRGSVGHADGVKQAWVLPGGEVLSLGVHGDVRRWNLESGQCRSIKSVPNQVSTGTVIGEHFYYIAEPSFLGVVGLGARSFRQVEKLPTKFRFPRTARILSLGDCHVLVVSGGSSFVLGPFPARKVGMYSRDAAPDSTLVTVRDSVYRVQRERVVEVSPLSDSRRQVLHVDEEEFLDFEYCSRNLVRAGTYVVTFQRDAVHVWDPRTRSLRGVDTDIHYADFPTEIERLFGFEDGTVLSWGARGNLWHAHNLEHIRVVGGEVPDGAITGPHLVLWNRSQSLIRSWREDDYLVPLRFRAHAGDMAGACNIRRGLILTWSEEDPALRVWNSVTGEYVKALGA